MAKLKSNQAIEIIENQEQEISDNYELFLKEIAMIERDLYNKIIASSDNNLTNAYYQAVAKQLTTYLTNAGYQRAYKKYVQKTDKILKSNDALYKIYGIDPAFSTIDINALKILKDSMFDNYEMIGQKAITEIKTYIANDLVAMNKTFPQFKRDLKDVIIGTDVKGGSLKKYTYTYANTSVMQFNRQQNLRLSKKAKIDTYLYAGSPLIKTSRKFCIKHYGKWYTREEIDKLDNPLSNNTFIECGGWNCRHQWIPIPQVILEQDGKEHGTGK